MLGVFPKLSISQNLVIDPSFEILDSCPNSIAQTDRLTHWYNPSVTTPDLFSTCSSASIISVPTNYIGHQSPVDGHSYICLALLFGTSTTNREYLTTRLNSPLTKDSIYCVSFYVSATDSNLTFTDQIGVNFSVDSVYQNVNAVLDCTIHISNQAGFIDNTSQWVRVEGYYVAKGAEEFLTIGNFVDPQDANWYGVNNAAAMYVDNVSVTPCSIPPDTVATTNYISVYPNPSRSVVSLDYGVISDKQGRFEMYDYAGKLAFKLDDLKGKYENTFALPQLSSGIYLWRFWVGDAIIETGKLVILKE